MVKIDYEPIMEIDQDFQELDKLLNKLWEKNEYNSYREIPEIKRFLSLSKRSPLPLSSSFGCFERWCKLTPNRNKINIHSFAKFVSEIQDIPSEVHHLIIDVARQYRKKHKLMDRLESKLPEYEDLKKVIIAHKNDIRDLKINLNDAGFQDCIVCKWQDLHRFIGDLINERFITIAIEPPALGDDLYTNIQTEILFLANEELIEIIKELIENMEIGCGYYPIHYMSDEKRAPKLLYSLEKIMLEEQREKQPPSPSSTKLDTLRDREIREILHPSDHYYGSGSSNKETISRDTTVMGIKGQEVIVAANKRDLKCIIFPLHASIFISGEADPIEAQKITSKTPTKISISKKNISIKVQFADWLVNEYDIGPLERRQFTWESFTDLLQDAVLWIEILKEASILYGRDELARRISNSGTKAQDLWYIPHWWESSEGSIITPTGDEIHIPSIEHPFRKEDLNKIADATINDTLRKNADRIWEATLEIQNQRRRFINAAHSYASLREGLQDTSEEKLEEELIQILESNELPDFFLDLMDEFETFGVHEAKKITLDKDLPMYKIIDDKDVFI